MSHLRLGGAAILASLLLTLAGTWVFDVWFAQILSTLSRASVGVAGSDDAAVQSMRTGLALALGSSPLVAIAVRAIISRLSGRRATLSEWAVTVGWLLFGSQVGLGGALFAAARVSIPAALDASALGDGVQVQAAELALANWAMAGIGGTAVIVAAIGLVTAGLERSRARTEEASSSPPSGLDASDPGPPDQRGSD